jgi:uroporphyrinogen-III synthase
MRLLMTKKISPSLALQAGLNGIDILEKEFIAVESMVNDQTAKEIETFIKTKNVVAFTSKNAVAAIASNDKLASANWKIFCIDGVTKKEVGKYFSDQKIVFTAKNADDLALAIIANADDKKVVFFCGNKRLNTLPDTLRANGFDVEEIVVYQTILSPQKIVDDFDVVAFFSPSAAESFFSLNQIDRKVICLSVGKTTSVAIRQYTQNEILTAKRPSEESVIELATGIINKI